MKKFLCALIIFVVVSTSTTAFANSTLENIGATILGQILNTVINDALRKNGMGDLIPDEAESSDAEVPIPSDSNLPRTTKTSGEVTDLSDEQYQSFSEICLAGSIEEFRKKIEYEKISPDAKYTKNDGSVVTLLELAKTSPNPELAEFLESKLTKEK